MPTADSLVRATLAALAFGVVWAVLGAAALVMSVVCLARHRTSRGAVGLAVATLLGPLYWVYYAAAGSRC